MCGRQTTTLSQYKNKVLIYDYYITDKDFVQVSKIKILKLKGVFLLCQN